MQSSSGVLYLRLRCLPLGSMHAWAGLPSLCERVTCMGMGMPLEAVCGVSSIGLHVCSV